MSRLILLALTFIVSSCGYSPLFNHELEKNKILSNQLFSESEALKFKKTDYSFALKWIEGPQMGGSKFIIRSWNKDLGTINGPYQDLPNLLHVFLWMPTMGHGSSPVKMSKLGPGEYEVSDVHFIMGGKWEVKFQLKKDNQVLDETILSLTI